MAGPIVTNNIIYKLEDTNTINVDGNRIYLEDATGDYSISNSGGYGTPNPTRTSTALFAIGVNKTSKGDVLVEFEKYNPLTASKFNAIIARDGWYVFSMAAIPIYNAAGLSTYTTGKIYYNATTGKLIKIVNKVVPIVDNDDSTQEITESILPMSLGTPFNTIIVKDIQEISQAELLGTSYVISTVESFFVANTTKTKNLLQITINNLIFNSASFSDKQLIRWKDNYNAVRGILQGSIYEYCRGNKAVAQKNMEFLNSNNYVSI